MLVDVSCARGVKWAAWHLQLQPLGLNKGRSLAAFPTQLSPFYHGFHSCFISSVSLHRVHTMRRHLGRVHSSVFSIFFPPVSGYFSFLLSFFFFFFCSPPADQSQSDGNPSDSSVGTHSQIVPASSLNFYDHGGVARTCRLAFVSSSARIILHDRFFLVGLPVFEFELKRFSISLIHQWMNESLRTVNSEELENLSPLRFIHSRNLL